MGRAKSAEIFSYQAEKCACSLFSPENSCCNDTHEFFIIDDFQVTSPGLAPDMPEFYVLGEVNLNTNQLHKSVKTNVNNRFNKYSPPPIPIYKVICSFVFYDDPYAGARGAC
jgi:hypothetical protein